VNDDEKKGWKQFQRLSFDSKKISKRMKKAEGATMRHAHKFIVGRLDNIRSVRRHVISWLVLVGVMIAAVGAQFMWLRNDFQTVASATGGTYAEGSLGPIETLNPLFASTGAEITTSRLLFSSLYTYDSTGHLKGDLAKAIQADPSGTVYTLTLRSDARWHDGTLLSARDVAFTVDLIKHPETRSPLRINWRDVTVRAIDDATLEFKLPAAYAAFPYALTFAVLPQHLLKDVVPGNVRESTFTRSPVGSGPFIFRGQQVAKGESQHKIVQLAANDQYYAARPLLGRFEVHAYANQEDIVRGLRIGEISAASDITGANLAQINKNDYTVAAQPINSGVYALFNTTSPLLKDKVLRQALQLATDTKAIRESLSVAAPPLSLPFIDGQIGTDIRQPPAYNVAQAEALLDSQGWVLNDGVRQKGDQLLELSVVATKNMQYEKALETLVGQWRKIGVTVSISVLDPSDPSLNFVQSVLQPRNYDVLLYELFIGADPDVYAYWHSSQTVVSGYNFSNYSNKSADDALASARSRAAPDLRNAKYKAFVNQWIDDAPAVGLYQAVAEYAHVKTSYSINESSKLISPYDRFSNVAEWSVNQRAVYKTP
jgi:peptide/nickel transport system substrate-binding protein